MGASVIMMMVTGKISMFDIIVMIGFTGIMLFVGIFAGWNSWEKWTHVHYKSHKKKKQHRERQPDSVGLHNLTDPFAGVWGRRD